MYLGRFLVVSPTVAAYRVSSRSFPNRRAVERRDGVVVEPTPDAPATDNPYVTYRCLRAAGDGVVVGNGSHVDPAAERIDRGYPPRDGLVQALFALDYEKDDYDTPRIAAYLDGTDALVGVVRRDALVVEPATEPTLVATYERDRPTPVGDEFGFPTDATAAAAARRALELPFEHPVCAVGVTVDDGIETAVAGGDDGTDEEGGAGNGNGNGNGRAGGGAE
jgi:IMP cyclohydrolase